jgi:2-methylcitrate dehydratase
MLYRRPLTHFSTTFMKRDSNQALGIGQYAIEFLNTGSFDKSVLHRVKLFHTDSVMCGLSAIAQKTNAPNVLRDEAHQYSIRGQHQEGYSFVFGSQKLVPAEKAICANASAVREWDSNGTVFGYNANVPGHTAGEFGHNDYYPVVIR